MEQVKYYWKKKIEQSLVDSDKKPLLPKFSFDWSFLQQNLMQLFTQKNLSLHVKDTQWKKKEEVDLGFGEDLSIQAITITPIEEKIFWIMNQKDISLLITQMITEPPIEEVLSEPLCEGYYRYLCLLTLEQIQKMSDFASFRLQLMDDNVLPNDNYLCVDIEIQIDTIIVWARLALPSLFLQKFKQKFQDREPLYQKNWERALELTLTIEGGKTYFDPSTFTKIQPGDFVLFDRLHYDPKHQKGLVTLMLNTIPLFHAKIKSEKIKILDYASYYEEKSMDNQKEKENFPEEEPIKEIAETEEEVFTEKEIAKEEKLESIKNTPLCITAEIGKISITLEKLLQLQPGNFLEMSIAAQDLVDLSINGKVVGKAEIMHLGEALGLRIIEINN